MAKSSVEWVPFREDGSLIEYSRLGVAELRDDKLRQQDEQRWGMKYQKNFVFDATLKFTRFSWGRSAGRAVMVAEDGATFPMFISEFERLLLDGALKTDVTMTRKWTFGKRGANYGLIEAR